MFQARMLLLAIALLVGGNALARKPCYVPRERRCEPPTTTYYRPAPRVIYYDYEPTTYWRTSYTYESTITIRTRISYTASGYTSGRLSSSFFD